MAWADIFSKIAEKKPIIHCITNIVTVNDCANVLLAIGASPVMAHHEMEVKEITSGSDALVCNMGAIENFEAMLIAGRKANSLGHPVVIDPVGVASSSYRRSLCLKLIEECHPTCIRGNVSEIKALALDETISKGVDAKNGESISDDMLKKLAKKYNTIIVVSGETDLVSDGESIYEVHGGTPFFKGITGGGCMSTVIIAGFLAIERNIESVAAAVKTVNYVGENAAKATVNGAGGSMTFKNEFINLLSILANPSFKSRKKRR